MPFRRLLALSAFALFAACGPTDAESPGAFEGALEGAAQVGPIPDGATMPEGHPPISALPAGHPDVTTAPQSGAAAAASAADARTGVVLEATQAAGYTYALMDFDGEELWVAGPQARVEVGDELTVSGLMAMTDFHARSLDRTFDAILFANTLTRDGGPPAPGR